MTHWPDVPRRPFLTRTRHGRLSAVFSSRDWRLHARIARVCVLFEDLRIEIAGIAADDLDRLDDTSKKGRSLYFLRRSLGTLYEFAEALNDLDQVPEFVPIRAAFNTMATRHWTRALQHFRRHASTITRVRHHVGGHFGRRAAELAVQNLLPDAIGAIEVALYSQRGGGAKLGFASEIAATALIRNLKGRDSQTKVRKLVRMAVVAYRHAVRAVDCITVVYLWDRFGK